MAFTIVAVFFGILAASGFLVRQELASNGVVVPGRIVERHGGKYGYLIVEFTTRTGRHIRKKTDLDTWGSRQEPGTATRVRYLSDDPAGPIEEAGSNATLIMSIIYTIPVLGFAGLAWALWTGRLVTEGRRLVRGRRRPAI